MQILVFTEDRSQFINGQDWAAARMKDIGRGMTSLNWEPALQDWLLFSKRKVVSVAAF